jgi:hypothetical protein
LNPKSRHHGGILGWPKSLLFPFSNIIFALIVSVGLSLYEKIFIIWDNNLLLCLKLFENIWIAPGSIRNWTFYYCSCLLIYFSCWSSIWVYNHARSLTFLQVVNSCSKCIKFSSEISNCISGISFLGRK